MYIPSIDLDITEDEIDRAKVKLTARAKKLIRGREDARQIFRHLPTKKSG